jgi:hypothetical protein
MKKILCYFIALFISMQVSAAYADSIFAGGRYKVIGAGAAGTCRLFNNDSACKETPEGWFDRNYRIYGCKIGLIDAPMCSATYPLFQALNEKRANLAIVPASEITIASPYKVLFYADKDKKNLVISGADFPKKEVERVLAALASVHGSKQDLNFISYLEFDREYPLHSGVAAFFIRDFGKPLDITTRQIVCSCSTGKCRSIPPREGVMRENYMDAQIVARLGKSVETFLFQALGHRNQYAVMKAANALGHLCDSDVARITPNLVGLMSHADTEVQEQAIIALGRMKPFSNIAVQKLTEMAQQPPQERPPLIDPAMNTIKIAQEPISIVAARTLASAAPEQALAVFEAQMALTDKEEQINAMEGLNTILSKAYLTKYREDWLQWKQTRDHLEQKGIKEYPEQKDVYVDELPAYAQRAYAILQDYRNRLDKRKNAYLERLLSQYSKLNSEPRTAPPVAP